MPTVNAKRKTKRKRATAKAGGSRTVAARSRAGARRTDILNQDMAAISSGLMLLLQQHGISISAFGRILGVSHTTAHMIARDFDVVSKERKQQIVLNFKTFQKEMAAIRVRTR